MPTVGIDFPSNQIASAIQLGKLAPALMKNIFRRERAAIFLGHTTPVGVVDIGDSAIDRANSILSIVSVIVRTVA